MKNANKRKPVETTIRIARPNSRAPEERIRLFEGLERIVNSGDSEADRANLALNVPSFWPINLSDKTLHWTTASWPLFLAFRNYLRRLWVSDFVKEGTDNVLLDGIYLTYLLGLEIDVFSGKGDAFVDARLPDTLFCDAWANLQKAHPNAYVSKFSIIVPDWVSGQFYLVKANDFQNAVHALLLESWRAKICRRCRRYFIADKTAQAYCSTACSGGNKIFRQRRYWKEKGTFRRKEKRQDRKGTK